ncbi:MAG TPA: ABC transporter substrate-binding protein [Rhodospirillaceae bacterium]|nr:ABC transporter substrate-binding protein [Rhodospirillaceae bacterium]
MTRWLLATLIAIFSGGWAGIGYIHAADSQWDEVVAASKGQVVYWHAWGGDEKVNSYIAWVVDQVRDEFGITLRHVKVGSISESVSLLDAEKTSGRTKGGRIDLLWLNGESFAALKRGNLLYGPFTHRLPNFAYVDTINKPTTLVDFTIPTDGMEAPWGMAQIVFFADTAHVKNLPQTLKRLGAWTERQPSRFTYPAPPDFTGTTFLKQALLDLVIDRTPLYKQVTESDFELYSSPLWDFLDSLHPNLWRSGKVFPSSYPALRQLMNDGEIDIAFSFNPAEVASAISRQLLPETVKPFVFSGGTIGNSHFLAIPKTASAKEGALVVVNFLLSPIAQAHKADPQVWGDPTVLDLRKLDTNLAALFEDQSRDDTTSVLEDLDRTLAEPHPSWTERLEEEWQRRYQR